MLLLSPSFPPPCYSSLTHSFETVIPALFSAGPFAEVNLSTTHNKQLTNSVKNVPLQLSSGFSFCHWDFEHPRHPLSRARPPLFTVLCYFLLLLRRKAEGRTEGLARKKMIVIDKVAKLGQGDEEEGDTRSLGRMR